MTTITQTRAKARGAAGPAQSQVRFLPRFSQLGYLSGAFFLFTVTFVLWAIRLP